jgi:hypothetical protein
LEEKIAIKEKKEKKRKKKEKKENEKRTIVRVTVAHRVIAIALRL